MKSKRIDEAIRDLTARQHGLVTIAQCRGAGIDRRAVGRRVANRMLRRVSTVVLQMCGSPTTPQSTLMAAVLDAGPDAVLSHQTAAAVWGLPGFFSEPVHVIADRGDVHRTSPYIATVHEPRLLLAHHVTAVDRLPIVTPSRLLFDLAGSAACHPKKVERIVDLALSRNLASIRSLESMLQDLARRGRGGIRLMRELIDERRTDWRPTESGLEFRFRELARRAGLADFERQVDVGDEHGWVGRVDFVDHRRMIIVETDTALHHGSLTDRRYDEQRRTRLRRAGWQVVAITDIDVFHRSEQLVASLRSAKNDARPIVLAG